MNIERTLYRQRKAWELDNDAIRVTVTQGGGHIAGLELRERPGINPLWLPVWESIEPWAYGPGHAARYGTRLLASILGHNLCLGWFGGPSADEQKAGMQCHGEASVARWRLTRRSVSKRRVSMTCGCELPAAGISFSRTLSSSSGARVLHVAETIVSRNRRDVPFTMAEHVTFSPPFLENRLRHHPRPSLAGRERCLRHPYPHPRRRLLPRLDHLRPNRLRRKLLPPIGSPQKNRCKKSGEKSPAQSIIRPQKCKASRQE